MKRIIRHTVILFFTLFVLAFPAMAGEHRDYGYQQLNDMQKAVYDEMVDAIAEHEDTVNLRKVASLTEEEFLFAHDMLLADHPEFFWYDGYISYSMSGSGNVTSATFLYAIGEAQLEEAQAAFDDQVEKILSSIPEEAESDYDKALYLYDLLVELITYKKEGYHQTAYGALVDRAAVCAGYARAYQHLLHQIGVDSFYVYGESVSPKTGQYIGSHAWNLVWLGGKCLYTDVTWGDPDADGIWHGYFNITYDEIAVSHIAAEEIDAILPKCEGHDDLDYYTMKSGSSAGVLDTLSMKTTAREFVEHAYHEAGDTYSQATVSVYCEDYSIFSKWWQKNGYDVWDELGYPSLQLKLQASDYEIRVTMTCGDVPEKSCGHRLAASEKQASCTEGASVLYSCLLCDYCLEENCEAALGHEWSAWSVSDDGLHERNCTRDNCDATETGAHDYVPAGEGSVTWEQCSVCGYEDTGAVLEVEGEAVTVYLGDWATETNLMIASFNQNGQLLEVYTASPESETARFTFQKDLNGCNIKVFFLMDSFEPWLKTVTN